MFIQGDTIIFYRYTSYLDIIEHAMIYYVFFFIIVPKISHIEIPLYVSLPIILLYVGRKIGENIKLFRTPIATLNSERIIIHRSNTIILWKDLTKVVTYKKKTEYDIDDPKKKLRISTKRNFIEFEYKGMPYWEENKAFIHINELEVSLDKFFDYLTSYYEGPIENNLSSKQWRFIKKIISFILLTVGIIALILFIEGTKISIS